MSTLHPCIPPKKKQITSLLHVSLLSIIYLFTIVSLGTAVCHIVYPSAQTALLVNVHSNELLVWYKASGFCYIINTGPSPRLLSGILLLPQVMQLLWHGSAGHIWSLQQVKDEEDVGGHK